MWEEVLFEIVVVLGTVSFAVSGSFEGIRKHLDILGITVLGFSTALGGGLIRDALLQRTPTAFIDTGPAIYSLIGVIIAVLLNSITSQKALPWMKPESKPFLIVDAIGLASFTVLGAKMGAEAGLNAFGIIMLAAITGVGGGVLRDILSSEIPLVLKADFYATATILGASVFTILYWSGVDMSITLLVTFVFTLVLRVLAIWFRWQLPKL